MLEIDQTGPRELALRGRLDATQSERCLEAIRALPESPVLDLAELKYIASAGISALVRAYQAFDERDQRITLRNLQPHGRVDPPAFA